MKLALFQQRAPSGVTKILARANSYPACEQTFIVGELGRGEEALRPLPPLAISLFSFSFAVSSRFFSPLAPNESLFIGYTEKLPPLSPLFCEPCKKPYG